MSDPESPPRTQFVVRHKDATEVYWASAGKPIDGGVAAPHDKLGVLPPCTLAQYSADGSLLACVETEGGIKIYNSDTGELLVAIPHRGVVAVAFSPRNSFVSAIGKPPPKGSTEGNFVVWDLRDGKRGNEVLRQLVRNWQRDQWPLVQWSDDEVLAVRSVSTEVRFFNGQDPGGEVRDRLFVPKVGAFQLAPGPAPYKVAVFIPEIKGQPAAVRVWHFPNVGKNPPVCGKSFYQTESVSMKWNSRGTHMLVLSHTDVDVSGKSYYGTTRLYLLQADGRFDGTVDLPKDGPVHDVQWNPTGKDFVAIYGFMPAQATMFDAAGKPLYNFGEKPRNCVKWSPLGRFLCLGGFGNLQGDMDFWDKNKLKIMGDRIRGPCSTVYEWAPDGRLFATAVCHPRMRVDNEYIVWRYNGEQLLRKPVAELYDLAWRPAAAGVYADRPQSPERAGKVIEGSSGASGSGAAKPAAYRPPGLRGTRATFSLRDDVESTAGKAGAAPSASEGVSWMGAGPPGFVKEENKLSKSQIKNLKRKQKKMLEAKEQEAADMLGVSEDAPSAADSSAPEQTSAARVSSASAAASSSAPSSASDASVDDLASRIAQLTTTDQCEKRVKALNKKLRQIQQLKDQKASGDVLEDGQLQKISSEPQIREELIETQRRMESLTSA